MNLDWKADFPIFSQPENANLVYLDSAATTQKPWSVIDAISHYYQTQNANVHRGVHRLSNESTTVWEESRQKIATFIGCSDDELILTRNTTESINGIVYGLDEHHIQSGDAVLVTRMEHHSNFVPWQQLAKRKGAKLLIVDVLNDGTLDIEQLKSMVDANRNSLKLCSVVHVSNTLGTINPVGEIVQLIRQQAPQALIVVDAAQSVAHIPVDFHVLDVDFLAFSGHKLYGPMGIGGLCVKKSLLTSGKFQPWLFGGGMIGEVHELQSIWNDDLSDRFTAGTPDVASAYGLATACGYVQSIGWRAITEHEHDLLTFALDELEALSFVKVIGSTNVSKRSSRIGSVAFLVEGVHAHDVAQILDSEGIAVRSGHHCTMPLHEYFGWPATVRASVGIYNQIEDINRLIHGLQKVRSVFSL